MHYLNHTLPVNYSYIIIWGQTSEQLTISTFPRKRHIELSNLKSIMLTPLLFHYSKIIKIADKVKIENCLFTNKYSYQ